MKKLILLSIFAGGCSSTLPATSVWTRTDGTSFTVENVSRPPTSFEAALEACPNGHVANEETVLTVYHLPGGDALRQVEGGDGFRGTEAEWFFGADGRPGLYTKTEGLLYDQVTGTETMSYRFRCAQDDELASIR
jgi:hypothetical protein